MKKIKLILPVLCIAVLLAACGGTKNTASVDIKKTTPDSYPLKTDVRLTWWTNLNTSVVSHSQSLNDTEFAKKLIKNTGVNIEFVHPAFGQETEQFNLMIASRELPDIIESAWMNYQGGVDTAINEKTILPIEDIIPIVCPNYDKLINSDPDYKRTITSSGGHIPGFAFFREDLSLGSYYGPMVRGDLLDKCGLSAPETIEDWETMLKAFKKEGISVPLLLDLSTSRISIASPFLGAFGVKGSFFTEDGKVKYGPYDKRYSQFVELMAKWYNEGLLDNNFTDTDDKRRTSIMAGGSGGAAFGGAGGDFGKWIPALEETTPGAYFIPVKYPVLKRGETPKFSQINPNVSRSGVMCAISGQCKDVEIAARVLDYGYSDDGYVYYNFGTEGETYSMDGDFHKYTDLITDSGKNGGYSIGVALSKYVRAYYYGPFVQSKQYQQQYYALDAQKQAMDVWSVTDELKNALPQVALTPEEQNEVSMIVTDVETYQQEMTFKAIAGTISLDEFNSEYFNEMKGRGIERAIEIYQQAYERYKK